MLVRQLRSAGMVGTGILAGCLWPAFLLISLIGISTALWDSLDWPGWILFVGTVMLFIGGGCIFALMVIIAVIAAALRGEWGWLLVFPAFMVVAFIGNVLLGLSMTLFGGGDEPSPPDSTGTPVG